MPQHRSTSAARATHQLQTPLVAVRAALTTLRDLDDQLTPSDRDAILEIAIRNAAVLEERVEAMRSGRSGWVRPRAAS